MKTTILTKPDTTEIIRRTAQALGVSSKEVDTEIRFYWMDIDHMFTWCCGHGIYVDSFGHFIMYTRGVYGAAKQIEKDIKKNMAVLRILNQYEAPVRKAKITKLVQDLLSRLILLTYSVELYKREVLITYPKKYKIENENRYKATIARVEKLLGIPLVEFPVTVNNPIQKVFVQKLRKLRVLQNPVIDLVGNNKRNSKV